MGQYIEPQTPVNEKEISLVDLVRFFFYKWKFLALTTAGVSAIAIAFSLAQPKQYQKQLTLSVKPVPVPVSAFPAIDVNQANTLAVGFLQNPKLDQTTARVKYEPTTQQIDLTLRSPNASVLTNASSKVVNHLETSFEKILGRTLTTSIASLEIDLKRNKQILNQLKQQSSQFSPTNESRLGALETQQAQKVASIADLEFSQQYLQQAQGNLAEFTSKVISIQILNESNVLQTRSPVQVAVIAIIASFMVAVLAAIIRDQILRLRNELSQQKPHNSSGV